MGGGESFIQFTYVDDVVQGFYNTLDNLEEASNQIFILGSEDFYTYNQLYALLAELCEREPLPHHIPPSLAKLLIAPVQVYNWFRNRHSITSLFI